MLDEEIYSNFQGKKLHLEKGQEIEFSGTDGIESILSPDYFEYLSENKARFKGETGDYSVLYDPVNELLYVEKPVQLIRKDYGSVVLTGGILKREWLLQVAGVWTEPTMCFIVIKVLTTFSAHCISG